MHARLTKSGLTLSSLLLAIPAQAQQFSGEDAAIMAVGGVLLVVFGIFCLVAIALNVWVAYTLMIAMQKLPTQYQQMNPAFSWFLFIPCFSLVWIFILSIKVSDSFQAYFRDQGRYDVGDCGKNLGITWGTLLAVGSILSNIPFIGPVFALASIASLVFMVMYTLRIKRLGDDVGLLGDSSYMPPEPVPAAPYQAPVPMAPPLPPLSADDDQPPADDQNRSG